MTGVLPSWVTDTGTMAAVFVAICSALAVAWRGATRVRRHADELIEHHLIGIRADVAAALVELRPNHQSSLRDAVDRIEASMEIMDRRVARCEAELVAQTDLNDQARQGKIDRRTT